MAPVIAVYDACVLYPAPLRDLLMHLACVRSVHARWTDTIHEEWTRNLLANRPDLTRAQLERTRALMERAVPDARVLGYESRIPSLKLPDPDDRHVLTNPPVTVAMLLETLRSAGLVQTAARLETVAHRL